MTKEDYRNSMCKLCAVCTKEDIQETIIDTCKSIRCVNYRKEVEDERLDR